MEFSEVIEVLDRGSSIDVQSNCTFESLMIGYKTLEKLKNGQFDRPSPVQAKAIPVGLLGRDMLVQAKSGTGKTLVFSVLAVENLDVKATYIQKVIITPTREISTQIKETVRKLSPAGTRTSVFVGGASHKFNLMELKKSRPQIVIGTPGRVAQLIRMGSLDMSRVDFFVLDEADKLMDDVFRSDINIIINSLPPIRQIAVFSATYPRNLDNLLSTFLRDAALVRFNQDDVQLVGIKQYVVPNCSPMFEKLTHVLKSIQYVQALVFCDQIAKCEPIATHLKSEGLDVTFVSSAISQKDRQLAVDQLRSKRVKILVSSDLTARGIDADNVNLVVNVDAAANEETYFHRIGRAARFGAHGAAITLLEDEKALKGFTALAYRGRVTVKRVSGGVDSFPSDLVKNQEYWEGLAWFADLNREQKTASEEPSDLKKVPDRQEAVEALWKSRGLEAGDSGDFTPSYKYTRDQMMAMKASEAPISKIENGIAKMAVKDRSESSEDVIPPSEASGDVAKDPDALPPKKSFKERLAELKKAKQEEKAKGAQPANGGVPVENKTKFKFVPTREKAKKKYYMRGELQHIRDSFTAEQWRAFAATKYDLSEEPFMDAFSQSESPESPEYPSSKSPEVEVKTSAENWVFSEEPRVSIPQKPAPKPKKSKDNVIRYSRHQMKQIQQAIPKKSWIPYIKSRYDTSEEPWELDPWMRCSYEERLRRIRKREKDERTKVIEDRKKKREEDRSELVSCGQTVQGVEIKETSWEEYQARVRREFEEFCEKEEQKKVDGVEPSLKRIGPVVPMREPAHIYNYRVDMYKRRLAEQDAWLMQTAKLEDGQIKDQEMQTDHDDVAEVEPEVKAKEIQTEPVRILEEAGEDEDYEEEEEDEEYWDEDEEEYWDEEEEKNPDDVRIQNLQNPMLQNLGIQYHRNVNLQAAQQSYIDFMNAVAREFQNSPR